MSLEFRAGLISRMRKKTKGFAARVCLTYELIYVYLLKKKLRSKAMFGLVFAWIGGLDTVE